MADDELAKNMRLLKINERSIDALLDLPKPSPLLEDKLREVQEMVADLPANIPDELVDEWNAKLANWWTRFAVLQNAAADDSSTVNSYSILATFSEPPRPRISFPKKNPVQVNAGMEMWAARRRTLSNGEATPDSASPEPMEDLWRRSTTFNIESNQFSPTDVSQSKLISKQLVRFQVAQELAKLNLPEPNTANPGSSADFDTLKGLFEVVQLARSWTVPFWTDNSLQSDVFEMIYAKLPAHRQDQYASLFDPTRRKHSLRDLKRFLMQQVLLSQHTLQWMDREFALLALAQSNGNESASASEAATSSGTTSDDDSVSDKTATTDSNTSTASEEANFELLKKLLRLLNKALTMVLPFDHFSQEAIFDCAMAHLPVNLRELYWLSFTEPKKSLRDLRKFIDDEIVFYCYRLNCTDPCDAPTSKEEVLAKMEKSYAELVPVRSAVDINALRDLFYMVCKVRAMAANFRTDQQLHAAMFEGAFNMLPPELRQLYFNQVQPKDQKSMLELSKFLVSRIQDFYRNMNFAHTNRINLCEEERPITSTLVFTSSRSTSTNGEAELISVGSSTANTLIPHSELARPVQCSYCRVFGNHTCDDCPTKKELQCFKCFKKGHKAKNCEVFTEH